MSEQELTPENKEFQNDIEEYRIQEKHVVVNFIKDNIKLGEILQRQRDKWKPKKKWIVYLQEIGRTLPYANQRIRLYEDSLNNLDSIVKLNLDSWHKVNMYLALEDAEKDTLLGSSEELEDATTEEFMEKVQEVKENEIKVSDEDVDWQETVGKAMLSDIPFTAKEILKKLNSSGHSFSNNCLPIVEGYVGLLKANKEFSKENFKALSPAEKKFWKGEIMELLKQLNK